MSYLLQHSMQCNSLSLFTLNWHYVQLPCLNTYKTNKHQCDKRTTVKACLQLLPQLLLLLFNGRTSRWTWLS